MQISFVDYIRQHQKYQKEIEDAILRVCNSTDRILRGEVKKFEEKLAEFVGTKYAVGLNSGTDALFLSLKLAGIGEGDEVITVGHTFHATVEAIHWNGAKPVLVDVGEDSMMSMNALHYALKTHKNVKAVVPVQLMGDMCDMDELQRLSAAYRFKIIEDACQALGSQWNRKKAGATGFAGCYSFFPAKILGAYGDAGAVTTNDEGLYQEMKDMREHYKYNPGKYGFNSRLDELQAAILNAKFTHIDEILKNRQHVADIYNEELRELPVKLPTKHYGRVYQDYIIRTPERDNLAEYLKLNGVETMKNDYHFPSDLPKPPATVLLESQTLRLPCNDVLEDNEVFYVCQQIKNYFAE